jgi:thiamine monophosphate synthase
MLSTPMDVAQANADGVHLEAEDDIAAEEVAQELDQLRLASVMSRKCSYKTALGT